MQRSFNDAGLVASTTYPCRVSGSSCADSARSVTNGYTRGLLTSVGTWSDAISYQANGMVAGVHHTNGTSETWTPDPNGMARPCSIIGTGSGGTVVTASNPCGYALSGTGWASGQYLYDGAGNVTQMGSTAYQYDNFSRLVGWSAPGPTGGTVSTSVSLDAYGNLLNMKVGRCQAAGACFHSSSVAGHITGTTNHYTNVTYDEAGNVTNDGRQFTYDPVGMMATSVIASRTFRYLYTTDDERIGVVEVTGTPVYTWTIRGFGNEILRNYRGTGAGMSWVEDEIWRGGSLLANERPSLTRHYALDHLGSPRALTSSTGTFLGTQNFQPYGTGGTSDGGALQFTGHERDSELLADTSGSMPDYFHARSYDVARGRFLSVDRHPGSPPKPQSWNRYAYVSNNPITKIDRDGNVEVRFEYMTFIPYKSVSYPAMPLLRLRGDGPGPFSLNRASFRTRQSISVETDPRKDLNFQYTGTTQASHVVTPFGDVPLGQADPTKSMSANAFRAGDLTIVSFEGHATVPVLPAAEINWSYGFVLNTGGEVLKEWGSHDAFPAHALTMQVGNSDPTTLVNDAPTPWGGIGLLPIFPQRPLPCTARTTTGPAGPCD